MVRRWEECDEGRGRKEGDEGCDKGVMRRWGRREWGEEGDEGGDEREQAVTYQ